ncbi:electron transfer flavoprotein subunit alpha/FixB family protein [Desulfobacula sp.]|uniref:electron transfer flavoprotein subunit alpha/FixB family protein n=1 Tax=Desulfobacula sp. TaxID=2593537 RepID=UPI00262B6C08|nr:electron transfer flavoprotein subunit alpha/FixB family protein [Desulfobacula sp.]
MKNTIWIWIHQRDGLIDDITFGLVQEARELAADMADTVSIVAIAMGIDLNDPLDDDQENANPLNLLGGCGVDRVIQFKGSSASTYHGESVARALSGVMEKERPLFFLMAHDADTADLAPRLAAMLQLQVVTRAVDLSVNDQIPTAVRPIANGHLFETRTYNCRTSLIVTLLPNVLVSSGREPDQERYRDEKNNIVIHQIDLQQNEEQDFKTRIISTIEAEPENLDITEADIILAIGRGVGKQAGNETALDSVYELARLLGASVAGTRPVIDRGDLPFERQIGQTGKTVTPRLIINCGISGANEYTAGIEKSKQVIAINTDARARIFRFASLGIVGDFDLILPLLIKRLIQLKDIG